MLSFALNLALFAAAPLSTQSVPNATAVQLGISLAFTHADALDRLRAAQQEPGSPDYRRWLTPVEFGERFGQPASVYFDVVEWLRQAGLKVDTYPSRLFLTAEGSAAQVE